MKIGKLYEIKLLLVGKGEKNVDSIYPLSGHCYPLSWGAGEGLFFQPVLYVHRMRG